jgi:hypothetical protein
MPWWGTIIIAAFSIGLSTLFFFLGRLLPSRQAKLQSRRMDDLFSEVNRLNNKLADQLQKSANPKTQEEAREIRARTAQESIRHLMSLPKKSQANLLGSAVVGPVVGITMSSGRPEIEYEGLFRYNKRISKIVHTENGILLLTCTWDGEVSIQNQFVEARQNCEAWDLIFDYQPLQHYATISGGSSSSQKNIDQLQCVRDYFLQHFNWKPKDL